MNRLMTIFPSVIIDVFNRVLEGIEKDDRIEKDISRNYELNIRQSKDELEKEFR